MSLKLMRRQFSKAYGLDGNKYTCCRIRRFLTVRAQDGGTKPENKAILSSSEWQHRSRLIARKELLGVGPRLGLQASVIEQQLDAFEKLLPNLPINLAQMRASDWARVVTDPDLGAKVIMLKVAFPSLNVESLLAKHPRTLLWSRQKLQDNLDQVAPVFQALPRPELVLDVLPELLDPKQCFSVVATLRKWFPKRDPLEVLQSDPDVVRRAEQWDSPLEPVFFDSTTGTWTSAGYSRNKQEDWQVYIEQAIYKRKPQPIDKQEVVVVGGTPVPASAVTAALAAQAAAAAEAGASSAPVPDLSATGEGPEVPPGLLI